jgi:hypothetical protein
MKKFLISALKGVKKACTLSSRSSGFRRAGLRIESLEQRDVPSTLMAALTHYLGDVKHLANDVIHIAPQDRFAKEHTIVHDAQTLLKDIDSGKGNQGWSALNQLFEDLGPEYTQSNTHSFLAHKSIVQDGVAVLRDLVQVHSLAAPQAKQPTVALASNVSGGDDLMSIALQRDPNGLAATLQARANAALAANGGNLFEDPSLLSTRGNIDWVFNTALRFGTTNTTNDLYRAEGYPIPIFTLAGGVRG